MHFPTKNSNSRSFAQLRMTYFKKIPRISSHFAYYFRFNRFSRCYYNKTERTEYAEEQPPNTIDAQISKAQDLVSMNEPIFFFTLVLQLFICLFHPRIVLRFSTFIFSQTVGRPNNNSKMLHITHKMPNSAISVYYTHHTERERRLCQRRKKRAQYTTRVTNADNLFNDSAKLIAKAFPMKMTCSLYRMDGDCSVYPLEFKCFNMQYISKTFLSGFSLSTTKQALFVDGHACDFNIQLPTYDTVAYSCSSVLDTNVAVAYFVGKAVIENHIK